VQAVPPTTPSDPATGPYPAWLETVLSQPPLERRGWQATFAPAYIGLFLWLVFFDQFPAEVLRHGGLGWALVGAGVAALLAFGLLFYGPTAWTFATGRPLAVVATSTFGVRGATWVPGLLLALVQVVWLAVATDYGTELCLRGLALLGLLSPRSLAGVSVGRTVLPSPLVLVTSLFWCYAIAMAGRYLVRVIAALMSVYPAVTATILGLSMIAALRGLPGFSPERMPVTGNARLLTTTGIQAVVVSLQMILGFFATAGLVTADLGAVSREISDVRRGGLVTVFLACWIVATLACLTVAGAVGVGTEVSATARELGVDPLSYQGALIVLFGDRLAAVSFLCLGLTALAPGCYAGYLFGTRMNELRPRVSRTRWTLIGVAIAWTLIAAGEVDRLAFVFSVIGALLAPVAGALTADYLMSRGRWPGARRGVNRPGVIAWGAGAVVGLLPVVAARVSASATLSNQPGVLYAYLVAFFLFPLLSKLGLESPADPLPESASAAVADFPT
jgi:cytosine permease